ncbi:MAG TPA: hypothetical protein VHX88_13810 [Solirubrobacteraceae bacterium]|nr:hypothetical protein [Solirubrobacteraceae bacterium]
MSSAPSQPEPRGLSGRWLALPLGMRWVLTLVILCCVSAGVVIGVHEVNDGQFTNTDQASPQGDSLSRIVVGQDQAPHTVTLPRRANVKQVTRTLVRAVTADMRVLIRNQTLDGPFNTVSCSPSGPRAAGQLPYDCTANAADFNYPFRAIANMRTHVVTFCKQDTTPSDMPQLAVALNAACVR